jgi:asparagine synthase (glutamine-hydrolysing)
MCGIAGFYGPPDHDLLVSMTDVIVHRGPDDEGCLETAAASIGFRRLSIIDIAHGHQPMANPQGDMHIAFNGELYNYRELRAELAGEGHSFSTESDTEVFLRCYEAWGPGCFKRFNGMWAVAILDERGSAPRLLLARDHFGIKPLYLAELGGRLYFASEIKALLAIPGLVPAANEQRLAEYLVRGLHDHDENTFFEGVSQVLPATYWLVDETGRRSEKYWEPHLSTRPAADDPERFRAEFKKAVERRLVADVTVGTCLSGGLDSSSIVCMMTELLNEHAPDAGSMGERLKTFSAVFDGDPIDEQHYIEPVLAATGAGKDFVRPVSADLFRDLPLLVWSHDEPIVSSGPYAQYRVMGLAAGKAKVLLDGQAGDELLAGYVPYQYVYLRQLLRERRIRLLAKESLAARDVLAPLVRQKLADRGGRSLDTRSLLAPRFASPERMSAVAEADVRSRDDLKLRLMQDLTRYSLPSLLRYEDRNSMAHSIESRVPFLDQELVELVLSLPAEAIVRDGWSRAILRDSMKGTLPEKIRLRRKKIGFTTPEIRWLRAQRAAVQGILRSPAFAARPWWDGPAIARAFAACCDGTVEESPFFWRVLDVEAWMRVFHGTSPLSPLGRRPDVVGSAAGRALADTGDREAVDIAGTDAARDLCDLATPNGDKHLFMAGPDGRAIYGRVPVRTSRVEEGDDVELIISSALEVACGGGGRLGPRPGDVVAVSEKAVAISQGRSFPVKTIRAGRLATVLARGVRKSSAGIGLGMPETMQLAIDEAGAPRIVLAAAAGAVARLFGRKGTFYRVAGSSVSAIDGPTAGTLPPYDTHAKLPPSDPDGVAQSLAERLSKEAGGAVSAVVVDANDRGAVILGASEGVDREQIRWLFADNPLGQGSEQTPVCLIRRVDAAR